MKMFCSTWRHKGRFCCDKTIFFLGVLERAMHSGVGICIVLWGENWGGFTDTFYATALLRYPDSYYMIDVS